MKRFGLFVWMLVICGAGWADFYAPRTFGEALATLRPVTWTPLTQSVGNLRRISFAVEGTQDFVVIDDRESGHSASIVVASDLGRAAELTNDELLRTIFKLIEVSSGSFVLASAKHANFAVDFVSVAGVRTIIMNDYRSRYRDEEASYLTFKIATSGTGFQLRATGRYSYSISEKKFIEDRRWTPVSLSVTATSVVLVDGEASTFTLYRAPLDQDIPFDINPSAVSRVSNDEVEPGTDDRDRLEETIRDISDAYKSQVSAPGLNTASTEAADAMLSQIQSDLAAEGSNLRYPAEFYRVVRESMLARMVYVSDVFDAVIGQNTIPYVYFTNETDIDGIHHPFLVIASYGIPEGPTLLWDVPRPPGDGAEGAGYGEQRVTRNSIRAGHMVKIAMKDYGEVESLTENILESNLAADARERNLTYLNYASVSATGVAIDGVVVYPSLNNRLFYAQEDAEITSLGLHSGRGLGNHYHADGFSATGRGLNLYSAEDYVGHTHPPIVSLGFDGVAGYGVYREGDVTSDGATVPLDEWGGHRHGEYGYHYHSVPVEVETHTSERVPFTAHMLPPRGAWRGRINDIPRFWDGRAPAYGGPPTSYHGVEERDPPPRR